MPSKYARLPGSKLCFQIFFFPGEGGRGAWKKSFRNFWLSWHHYLKQNYRNIFLIISATSLFRYYFYIIYFYRIADVGLAYSLENGQTRHFLCSSCQTPFTIYVYFYLDCSLHSINFREFKYNSNKLFLFETFKSMKRPSNQWPPLPCKHFGLVNYYEQPSKKPCGPFGTKPAKASAFISVSIQLDTEATLAGFAMSASPSAFNSV